MSYLTRKNIILTFIISSITLLLFEVVAHSFLPINIKRTINAYTKNVFHRHPDLILFDKKLGIKLRPNKKLTIKEREFTFTVTTNSKGFRDDEKSLFAPNIITIGDSFTFGTGVNQESIFSNLIEEKTGQKVLNAGIGGYSTLQEFISYNQLIEAGIIQDQTTFFFYFSGNDLKDNMGYNDNRARPLILQKKASLYTAYPIKSDFYKWQEEVQKNKFPTICKKSYTAFILVKIFKKLMTSSINYNSVDYSRKFDAFEYILKNHLPKDPNKKIVFIYIPSLQFYENKKEKDDELIEIQHIMNTYNIPLIDLTSVLSEDDYFPIDGHWNEKGHAKCAIAVSNYIIKN